MFFFINIFEVTTENIYYKARKEYGDSSIK